MKVGAEPRKVAILALLLVVAAYALYTNVLNPDDGIPDNARNSLANAPPAVAAPPAEAPPPKAAPPASSRRLPPVARRAGRSNTSQEWTPQIGFRREEDRPDPATVDPLLETRLLVKLKEVTFTGGERSIFDFSQPPAPKVEAPKILPVKQVAETKPAEPKPDAPPPQPPKPRAPPVPLKYYGFVTGGGPRRAFFLNGEEIFVASEGDIVQRRYKIVRINVNSAVVSDTQFENDEQTLRLEPQQG